MGDTENVEFEILSGSIEISAILFGVVRVLSNYISITIKLHLTSKCRRQRITVVLIISIKMVLHPCMQQSFYVLVLRKFKVSLA